MAVVKADGYGHGAVEVAGSALSAGANRLAVALVDEAVELRRAGIGSPILILGHTSTEFAEQVVKMGLTAAVTETGFAHALSASATRLGRKVKVHLKIDTGMGRLGVRPEEAVSFADFLAGLPHLELEGAFTHFASADSRDTSSTLSQLSLFREACLAIEARGHKLLKHAANTAATLALLDSHLDMIRLGIGLYGLYPSPHLRDVVRLRPALSLRSHIAYLKWVDDNVPLGYGGTHTTRGRQQIATVPIGYADGYSRQLSNQGMALVNGRQVPLVGRVCMDQILLEVTRVDCSPGDEVVLIGEQHGQEITADQLASLIGTINYEVVSVLSRRIPRVFLRNNQPVRIRTLLGRN
jgi:alanine racemase